MQPLKRPFLHRSHAWQRVACPHAQLSRHCCHLLGSRMFQGCRTAAANLFEQGSQHELALRVTKARTSQKP